ncbi:MAG: hypothetical protein ACR2LS_04055 [Thermomicrobiales bacterium]
MGEDERRETRAVRRPGRVTISRWNERPLANIRIGVRRLAPLADPGEDAVLRWDPGATSPSEPLDDVLSELRALDDAPPAAIVAFARRFGPLNWPDSDHAAALASNTGETPASAHEESLALWRQVVRDVETLVSMGIITRPGNPPVPVSAWWEAFDAANAIVEVRRRGARVDLPFAARERHRVKQVLGSVGPAPTAESQHDLLDQILDLVQDAAEVRSATVRDERGKRQPGFAMPAIWFSGSTNTGIPPHWQVDSLLHVIALAVAYAPDDEDQWLCSRCGHPAKVRPGGRRPRRHGDQRYPWYGDHEQCRVLARAESLVQADDLRFEKRRAARGLTAEVPGKPVDRRRRQGTE